MTGILALAVLVVFVQVLGNDFISYDDDKYLTANPYVQNGLTREGIVWAFTATRASNWHPLTWISHMLDVQLYGMNPRGHHLTNLLLHLANTLLLLRVLQLLTGSIWPSAFVAALFGVHPLHVESVAWAAERKDVLSTLFWMLTMLAYVRYTKRPTTARYVLVFLALALGLMAKPMPVTLPLVLLLLDYWPLGRPGREQTARSKWLVVYEKLPLLALSVASSALTFLAQRKGGAVAELDRLEFGIRAANALVVYVAYIGKMIWPRCLSVFYPHPADSLPAWQVIGAGLLLVCTTALVLRVARSRPYLAVGWLWYIVTLIPVVGLVQVGLQAMADRYTYVPLIGIFVMIAWTVQDWMARDVGAARAKSAQGRLHTTAVVAGAVLAALMVRTWIQVGHWRDDQSLFSSAIACTSHNYIAHNNLGVALSKEGKMDDAIAHYRAALSSKPDYALAHFNLGYALSQQGRNDEAIERFTAGLRVSPDDADAQMYLALLLSNKANLTESERHYRKSLEIRPDHPETLVGLGVVLTKQGRLKDAEAALTQAVKIKPDSADAEHNLGVVLANQKRYAEAITHYEKAIQLQPGLGQARANLAIALYSMGRYSDAWKEVRLAERNGSTPPPALIQLLSRAMPEPTE